MLFNRQSVFSMQQGAFFLRIHLLVSAESTYGAFLYNAGVFTFIDVPGVRSFVPYGINDSGQIVGQSDDHSYLYSGGVSTKIDVPGAIITRAQGINNSGQIVGMFTDSSLKEHGFLYNAGMYTQIDFPGATTDTRAYGINDSGQIVGEFWDNQIIGEYGDTAYREHGFLYDTGVFTQIDFPIDVNAINPSSINNLGQILCTVGYWPVPEPTTMLLLSFGLVGLAGIKQKMN